jgi:hypothetical protein
LSGVLETSKATEAEYYYPKHKSPIKKGALETVDLIETVETLAVSAHEGLRANPLLDFRTQRPAAAASFTTAGAFYSVLRGRVSTGDQF